MEKLKRLGILFSLVVSSALFSVAAVADHGHSGPGGHCKQGDVYCGGECHSSWDKCPGHGDHDNDGGHWGGGYCATTVQCSGCYGYPYYSRQCRTIDCHGYVVSSWNESCY